MAIIPLHRPIVEVEAEWNLLSNIYIFLLLFLFVCFVFFWLFFFLTALSKIIPETGWVKT